MSEMQCAGVRRDLHSAMCAMSKKQCAAVRPWDAVPSSRKTYPCQKENATKNFQKSGLLGRYLVIAEVLYSKGSVVQFQAGARNFSLLQSVNIRSVAQTVY
jgi:hypothetical protein